MPDDPISTTPNLALKQYAEGANPGAEPLNENWQTLDTAVGALEAGLTAKAPQTSVDSLDERVNDLETADAENVKRDGSVAMTGDLDFGGQKALNAANAATPTGLVTKQQMEAAVAALAGSLVGTYSYVLARNTEDIEDTSPVLFVADENDASTTNEDMHVEGTPPYIATQDGFYLAIFRGKIANGGGGSCKWLVNGVEAPACVLPLVLPDVGFLDADNEGHCFLQDVCPMPLLEGDEVTLEIYGLDSEPLKIKAESTVAMFLLSANAAGGGDLKSDGTVPMTADFNNGANKQTNMADGVADDDGATVGQLNEAVEDLQEQIDDLVTPNTGTLQAPEWESSTPGSTFSFGTSWSELSASRLEFPLAAETIVIMEAEATCGPDFVHRTDAQLGIRLQKLTGPGGSPDGAAVDIKGTEFGTSGQGFFLIGPVTCKKRKTIAAGIWRASIICRRGQAVASSGFIYTDDQFPARLGLTYMA